MFLRLAGLLCVCVCWYARSHTHMVVPLGCDLLCVAVCRLLCFDVGLFLCLCVLYTKVFVSVVCKLLCDDVYVDFGFLL